MSYHPPRSTLRRVALRRRARVLLRESRNGTVPGPVDERAFARLVGALSTQLTGLAASGDAAVAVERALTPARAHLEKTLGVTEARSAIAQAVSEAHAELALTDERPVRLCDALEAALAAMIAEDGAPPAVEAAHVETLGHAAIARWRAGEHTAAARQTEALRACATTPARGDLLADVIHEAQIACALGGAYDGGVETDYPGGLDTLRALVEERPERGDRRACLAEALARKLRGAAARGQHLAAHTLHLELTPLLETLAVVDQVAVAEILVSAVMKAIQVRQPAVALVCARTVDGIGAQRGGCEAWTLLLQAFEYAVPMCDHTCREGAAPLAEIAWRIGARREATEDERNSLALAWTRRAGVASQAQRFDECDLHVDALRRLAAMPPDSEDLVSAYAEGLAIAYDLAWRCGDVQRGERHFQAMSALVRRRPGSREPAVALAEALALRHTDACDADAPELAAEVRSELGALAEEWPDTPSLRYMLAEALAKGYQAGLRAANVGWARRCSEALRALVAEDSEDPHLRAIADEL